jgi:uncharacterized protein YbjT (DUF2867 family)
VAGATGRLGRHVSEVLAERGHKAVAMSRATCRRQASAPGSGAPLAYVPEMRTQIVSARTVAEVVADVATSAGDPAEIVQIAGPREEDLAQLAAMLVAHRGTPVKIQAVRNPADPDADMQATGGLLPGPGTWLAGPTFEEWLDQQ